MPVVIRHKWDEFAQLGLDRFREHKPRVLALDTETTGLTWKDTPFGMSVAWRGPTRTESFWFELEDQKPMELAWLVLREHLDRGGVFRFFNAKFDIIKLLNYGLWSLVEFNNVQDALAQVALLSPAGDRKLKPNAERYLGRSRNNEHMVAEARKELGLKVSDGYWPIPREIIVPYALDDAEMTLDLYDHLEPLIVERELQYAFNRERLVLDELIHMEVRGVAIDKDALREQIKVCDVRMAEARTAIEAIMGIKVSYDKLYEMVDTGTFYKNGNPKYRRQEIPTFNPNSNPQVLAYFHSQGIHLDNAQESTLLRVDHPLIEQLVILSKEQKLRNTYLVPLLEQTDEDGIMHPNLNQFGTGTGRFSASKVKA